MRSKPVTKWGIPINLVVALVIGFFTANYSVETGRSISDALVHSLAIGIVVQEIVLVQVLLRAKYGISKSIIQRQCDHF